MEHYYQPEIECAPYEEIRKIQSEKLVKQVKHVWDNVPYYRTKMEEKALLLMTSSLLMIFTNSLSCPKLISGKPIPTALLRFPDRNVSESIQLPVQQEKESWPFIRSTT